MTEQELLWLIARAFIVLRLDGVTSHMRPHFDEMCTLLTNAAGFTVSSMHATDSQIVDHFRPRDSAPIVPKSKKTKGD